jgi:glycerophosphoryl diester phosphodiesterase
MAQQLQCAAVVCNHRLWNRDNVAQVHAAGMRALSYTVNDKSAAAHLIALGTDGIVTDAVDQFAP